MTQTTTEIRRELERLRRIHAVAEGNTAELERGIRERERELASRDALLDAATESGRLVFVNVK